MVLCGAPLPPRVQRIGVGRAKGFRPGRARSRLRPMASGRPRMMIVDGRDRRCDMQKRHGDRQDVMAMFCRSLSFRLVPRFDVSSSWPLANSSFFILAITLRLFLEVVGRGAPLRGGDGVKGSSLCFSPEIETPICPWSLFCKSTAAFLVRLSSKPSRLSRGCRRSAATTARMAIRDRHFS